MRSVQWGRVDEAPEGVGGPETWGGVCRSATTDGCLALGSVSWRLLARLALPPPSAVAARSCTGGRPLHRLLHAAGLRVHHARGARRLRCQRRDEPAAAVVRCALPPTVPGAGRPPLARGGRRRSLAAGQLPQLHSDLARLAARRRCSLLFCTCIDRVVLQFAQACLRSSVRPPSIRRSVARDARPATSVSPRLCRPPHDSKRALAPRVCRCLL